MPRRARLPPAGVSAHQKLELLRDLVHLLGYDSLAVFGDCFDEVTLLDPVRFPGEDVGAWGMHVLVGRGAGASVLAGRCWLRD